MNETLKVLETRRSCRKFITDKMVPDEEIKDKDNYVYYVK